MAAWADRYRFLAPEAGSSGGPWETSRVEVARGPMLAVTEPGVHIVTLMCCTQLLKTAFIENTWGYFAHLDPCPTLLLQPKDEAAKQFSRERISPRLRVTPVLRALIGWGTSRTGDPDDQLLFKAYRGGFLALAGAGSPDNLARRPIRLLLADEVDKYPLTREGDPIALAEERTATFDLTWLSVRACSPTIQDDSRIDRSYQESDRRRASVECPHCGHRMFPDFFRHVEWPKRRNDAGEVVEHEVDQARIHCEACGVAWSEGDRLRALQTVRWHQTRPFECCGAHQVPLEAYERAWRGLVRQVDEDGVEVHATAENAEAVAVVWDWWEDREEGRWAVYRARCAHCGRWAVDNRHAGFQASKLFSPWQKDRPADVARKWLEAKGHPEREQAWWNTQMGLPHRPAAGRQIAVSTLLERRETWAGQVPAWGAVLTCGVDVQDDRLELEVVAWGRDEESWSIAFEVIEGEMGNPDTQARLDAYLGQTFTRPDGSQLVILATCIDSGGHHTQAVYQFAKARLGRRVWAIKGASERDGQRNPVWPAKRIQRRNRSGFKPVVIGGNTARDVVRGRLTMESTPAPGVPLAGYMHFPADRDVGYFEQLLADRLVVKTVGARSVRLWETPAGKANEAADCRVYAYAALCGLIHAGLQLNRLAMRLTPPGSPPAPSSPGPSPAPTPTTSGGTPPAPRDPRGLAARARAPAPPPPGAPTPPPPLPPSKPRPAAPGQATDPAAARRAALVRKLAR